MENLNSRFIPKEIWRQSDNQSCLSCCLLIFYAALSGEELDFQRLEQKIYQEAYGLYPESYALSHVTSFVKNFPDATVSLGVENEDFCQLLEGLNREPRISINHRDINQILDVKNGSIIYLDAYYLGKYPVHTPHFVYAFKESGLLKMADPGFGEIREISNSQLENAVNGLKFYMLWSPIDINLRLSD